MGEYMVVGFYEHRDHAGYTIEYFQTLEEAKQYFNEHKEKEELMYIAQIIEENEQ